MRLGYELIREQLFFQKELIERVYWFIRLRWLAAAAALAGSCAAFFFARPFPVLPLTIIALFILAYNLLFLRSWKSLSSCSPLNVDSFNTFAHVQIGADLAALFGMILFTGGFYSPLLIFSLFHILLAGILLTPFSCFAYGIAVLAVTGIMGTLQYLGILSLAPVLQGFIPFNIPSGPTELLVSYAVFTVAVLVTAFLTTSLKMSLRLKGRELLETSKELEASNRKLKALYEMLKKIGLSSDLQELMDLTTRSSAGIMGVKACSIKLLDEGRRKLKFASAYGLSEDYVSKGAVDIDKSPINRKIIEGSFFSVGKIEEKDYFQYPEDIRKEGIASMVCLPLRVEKMVLGVFCVYSDIYYNFEDEDIRFFSLISDLVALAIETLRSEMNKTWFLQKTAHQLRSPFSTIYSMIKVMNGGFLGPVNDKQKELLQRCIRRIEMLGDLVNDLLKLGIKRTDADRAIIHPVDGVTILNALVPLFETHAREKRLKIEFQIEPGLDQIMGDEKLLDELMTNLISNAIKYTPAGGKVEVHLSREDKNRIRLEVRDTGIGIPEEDRSRLFTEFFRAENAKSFCEEGTGLGLVIVKEIVDFLRGAVLIESKVGEGTTVCCLLPAI
ncbi:MAG: GAF domain-containing protein [Desulfobacteraceae bacterium]|nr:MAG: GAF domain-containing protein [Desulfobacteraceae bacterium]